MKKVDGYAGNIKGLNVIEKVKENGDKMRIVKDCVWSDPFVEDGEKNAPTGTRFCLYLGDNPATGKPRYTDKVVVVDESGKPVQKGEKDGKPVYQMRYVGPQDAMPGSTLTIVWSLSKLYLTESTGPIAEDVAGPRPRRSRRGQRRGGVRVDRRAARYARGRRG
jgi:hypothetical protein